MSKDLTIQQQIQKYRNENPKLRNVSDKEVISIMIDNGVIMLTESQKVSIYAGNKNANGTMGISVQKQSQELVNQDNQFKNAVNVKTSGGKIYNLNKTMENRINLVASNLQKTEDENGFIGSTWSGFKNSTGIGDSSDKVREQLKLEEKLLAGFNSNEQNRPQIFKQLTGQEYNHENLEKFIKGEITLKSELALKGYKEGQEMAVDIGADILSGVAAVGIYTAAVAAAPFTGGASIAVGVVSAAASGAAIKTGIKYADAKVGGREYESKDLMHDTATGAFSGVIAPVTGGIGGAIGKTVATKLGVQAVKQAGKEVIESAVESGVKQTVKTMLTNPTGYEYAGGNIVKRGLAFGAEVASDGAIGGAFDNSYRTAIDGGSIEDIGQAALDGAVGGAILSPVIGGGFKAVGKAGAKVKGSVKVSKEAAEKIAAKEGEKSAKLTRAELKNKLKAEMSKQNIQQNGDIHIEIPKAKLRAPSEKFAETDEAFANIIKLHQSEFIHLDKKNGDDFINEAFSLIKKYMDLDDCPIKIKITNDASSCFNQETATLELARNWKNGDKAELAGAIAHELDHFFQNKEMYINHLISDTPLIKIDSDLEGWLLNNFDKYGNNHNAFYVNKANVYLENFKHYIEPNQNYQRYRAQPVEAEAHRRGDIVRDEYKQLVSKTVTEQVRLDELEQAALTKILNYYEQKGFDQQTLQEIIDVAIADVKDSKYINTHPDDFVRTFIASLGI